jgi:hypothetical protein
VTRRTKRSAKSRSGTTLSQEERRASGANVVASFTLPQEIALLIGVLAANLGVSRSEIVRRGVDALWRGLPESGGEPLSVADADR